MILFSVISPGSTAISTPAWKNGLVWKEELTLVPRLTVNLRVIQASERVNPSSPASLFSTLKTSRIVTLASITLLSTGRIIARESQLPHRYSTFTSPRSRLEKSQFKVFRTLVLFWVCFFQTGHFGWKLASRGGLLEILVFNIKQLTREFVQVSATRKSSPLGSCLLIVHELLVEINISWKQTNVLS